MVLGFRVGGFGFRSAFGVWGFGFNRTNYMGLWDLAFGMYALYRIGSMGFWVLGHLGAPGNMLQQV